MPEGRTAQQLADALRLKLLGGVYKMTLHEVAAELGLSYQRVWQIEQAALSKLRVALDVEQPNKRRCGSCKMALPVSAFAHGETRCRGCRNRKRQ
jgi:hypothetical protein